MSAIQLPDPKLSVSTAIQLSDSFNFGQKPKTQFKLGISQQFFQGISRVLKQQMFLGRSEATIDQRLTRIAFVQ